MLKNISCYVLFFKTSMHTKIEMVSMSYYFTTFISGVIVEYNISSVEFTVKFTTS